MASSGTLRHNSQVPLTSPSRLRRVVASAIGALLAAALLVFVPSTTASATEVSAGRTASTAIAKALVTDGFQAGNIMSDAVFFNSSTMTAAQIDSFLRSKVSTCQSGYTCLKDYRQKTPNRTADAYCNGYAGSSNESAATMIAKVAQSCGINPQVLLVMLEKEQSLVTHTWPSDWRYTKAFGMACPDTAACDPAYAGLFNQLYGAARQMKIYTEGKYFTYYAPGKTWNIRYSPNAACGSSAVYIQNKATAALYYYTPYQPNAAALKAGFGTGDSCSAYGNRNFYSFFTQWFGSTQSTTTSINVTSLIRATDGAAIYLAANGVRYHVSTVDDLDVLTAKFGAFQIVSPATVNALRDGGTVTRSVRDPRNGTIYLLEKDGTKHRFPTVDLVTALGYIAQNATDMPAAVIDAFSTGAEVNSTVRLLGKPEVYWISGTQKRYVVDPTALASVTGSTSPYSATIAQTTFNAYSLGTPYLGAGRLVRAANRGEVYLTTATSTLIHVPSIELAQHYGAKGTVDVVDASALPSASIAKDTLLPTVRCGSELRVVDGNGFRTVTGTVTLRATRLAAGDCAAFPASSGTLAAPLFVATQGNSNIYAFDGSTSIRLIQHYEDLVALNNGSARFALVSWSADSARSYGIGAPLLAAEGVLLSFSGDTAVYQMRSGVLRYVVTWNTAVAIGGSSPTIQTRSASERGSFTFGTPVLADKSIVRFNNGPDVYYMSDGKLNHVQTYEALLRLGNGSVPRIESIGGSTSDYTAGPGVS